MTAGVKAKKLSSGLNRHPNPKIMTLRVIMWLCGLSCIRNMVATAAVATKPNIVILFVDGTGISIFVLYRCAARALAIRRPPLAGTSHAPATHLHISIPIHLRRRHAHGDRVEYSCTHLCSKCIHCISAPATPSQAVHVAD